MEVRMLDGPFKGEIKDLRNDVALEFLAQKRAERAYQDPPPVVAAAAVRVNADAPRSDHPEVSTRKGRSRR